MCMLRALYLLGLGFQSSWLEILFGVIVDLGLFPRTKTKRKLKKITIMFSCDLAKTNEIVYNLTVWSVPLEDNQRQYITKSISRA